MFNVNFSVFNGYGYHVKMADFGDHMIVGAPGTYLEKLEAGMHSSNFVRNVTLYSTHNSTPGNHAPFRTSQFDPNGSVNSSSASTTYPYSTTYPRTPLALLSAQIGQVRIMKCTPDVSWGAGAVSQMGNIVHGYDAGVVKIDTFNNNQTDSFSDSMILANPS